jgi:NAD(P)-dependent dehydrogenase (short-subunit alcohol dehydrogenase family)
MDVKGSVVVITGGGTGIGAAVAKNLAAAGAKVALAGRRIERLEQTVAEIKADGGEAIAVQTDVTKEEDLSNLMDKAIEEFGSLNVVLANAGRFADSLMINTDKNTGKVKSVMSTEQFKAVVDTNLIGTFLTLREAARRMADNGWEGLLLITSSIRSTIGSMCSSFRPRVVIAGVPTRKPLVWNGDLESNGTIFLLMVMSAISSVFSTFLPVMSGNLLRRSINIKWFSVPPEITL